jgi:hypothetical protein
MRLRLNRYSHTASWTWYGLAWSAPTPDYVDLLDCLSAGVCSSGVTAACNGGTRSCDYSGVGGYEVTETTCDYLDNDCDGLTDEGLLNACGGCGAVPEETCNGIDDDCDYLSRVWTPGRTFLLHRDASDREDLISVEGSTPSVWTDYDLAGRLLREEFRESGQARVIVDYEFDGAGRLLTKLATLPDETLLYGVSYTYDVRGLVETITESDELGVINVRTFVHDEVGRLVWADYTDGPASWEYHYDWAGSRSREIYEGLTTDYTMTPGNRLSQVTDSGITQTLGYDDLGSVISWTVGMETDGYGYNAPGRMTSADVDSGLWTYAYDVDAWRVRKSGPGNVDLYYFRDQRTLDERTGLRRGHDRDAGVLPARRLHPGAALRRHDVPLRVHRPPRHAAEGVRPRGRHRLGRDARAVRRTAGGRVRLPRRPDAAPLPRPVVRRRDRVALQLVAVLRADRGAVHGGGSGVPGRHRPVHVRPQLAAAMVGPPWAERAGMG